MSSDCLFSIAVTISVASFSVSIRSFVLPLNRVPFIDPGDTSRMRFAPPHISISILIASIARNRAAFVAL